MNAPTVILGAGGLAREILSWFFPQTDNVVFFSEHESAMKELLGHPVISSLDDLSGASFVSAVGDPRTRQKLWCLALSKDLKPIPAMAYVASAYGLGNEIGDGSFMCPFSVISTGVTTGLSLLLNLGATIGHDCRLGDFVTIGPGANVSGNVSMGDRCYVGTNACIREGVSIGSGAIVGMGAVVVNDVPANAVVVGNPARQRRGG